jgi:hypothetical protein
MNQLSNEARALSRAGGRAGLAVLLFAALTAWPLLAGAPANEPGSVRVAQIHHADPSQPEGPTCRT